MEDIAFEPNPETAVVYMHRLKRAPQVKYVTGGVYNVYKNGQGLTQFHW